MLCLSIKFYALRIFFCLFLFLLFSFHFIYYFTLSLCVPTMLTLTLVFSVHSRLGHITFPMLCINSFWACALLFQISIMKLVSWLSIVVPPIPQVRVTVPLPFPLFIMMYRVLFPLTPCLVFITFGPLLMIIPMQLGFIH